MIKLILISVLISMMAISAFYILNAAAEESKIVTNGHESIIGRSSKYIPPSAAMSTLTMYIDPTNSKISNMAKAAELCMTIDGVKSAALDKNNPVLTLSVDGHFAGSVEAVADNVKSALKNKLDISVIESRVLN